MDGSHGRRHSGNADRRNPRGGEGPSAQQPQPQPQPPTFRQTSSIGTLGSSESHLTRSLDAMRLSENTSVVSNNSDNLALLINLDEIIGNLSSFRTTPDSRMETPALSEGDPGTETEVRLEDLATCDIQGVNWGAFSVSRDDYRAIRMREYREFEAMRRGGLDLLPEEDDSERVKVASPLGPMLSFRYMNKVDSCNVPHFQLRHLLCAPTVRSVIFPHFLRIKSWNPVTNHSDIVLNTADLGAAFSKTSVIACTESHLFVGGFSGEIITKSLDNADTPSRLKTYSTDPNCITNHISPLPHEGKLLVSCNDAALRMMDVETGKMRSLARFPYAVNATEAAPDRKLIATVGDSKKIRLLDFRTAGETAALEGHADFCFSCAWSPCGRLLATGSQDRSARIYDIRMSNRSLHTLAGTMAAVRNVAFSPCGSLFAMMEADDFVHAFSVKTDFREGQTIDFFGEISGIAFDPTGANFYVGCAGMENGGIMEFHNPFSIDSPS